MQENHVAADLLSAAIREGMKKKTVVGQDIRCFSELGSTNTYAKTLALTDAPDGTVILADRQTAGRGRMNRLFQSPGGKGIYLSVLLRPQLPPQRLPRITALAGIAVCNAVERVCGVRPGVKWPNDLLLGGKKLCGILTELVMDDRGNPVVILGIGVNVSQTEADFSPDVAEIAVSLQSVLGHPVSRTELMAAMFEELDDMYAALQNGQTEPYHTAYRRDCVHLGQRVLLLRADGLTREAMAVDITPEFALQVRYDDGALDQISTGEISVRFSAGCQK